MKRLIVLILSLSCIGSVCLVSGIGKEKVHPVSGGGFALIELYSSEGCSSCPAAESLMDRIEHNADSASIPVYVIEFHVDYWDYIGWKDSLASASYSDRQQQYGDYFKLSSIYTPEVVINGETEMSGGNDEKINEVIKEMIQQPASVKLDCKVHEMGKQQLEVGYNVTGNVTGCSLNFAVVESGLTVHIKRGENARRTFTHNNVVRIFKSIKLNLPAGKANIETPHLNLMNSKLICFVQNKENMNIIAAVKVPLSAVN
jgi:hypothetical protein